ncbi:MAG TPA: hypothetical protein ENK83_01695 [Aliiroseovarius sp.]|nr:hypothetical protein [Aliiroseovarius sp.]
MMRALPLALLLLAPVSLHAQPLLDGAGFAAATQGNTFVFSLDGVPYGAEQYLPGNRVNWSFLDGRCLAGHWWQEAQKICFAYEDRPGENQCWEFWQEGGGLRTRFTGDGAGGAVYSAQIAPEPLYCMGPDAGV